MKNIILIGMPGSGKTTLGKILSRRLNMPFVDTDNLIEEQEGKSLQQVFDERGLENFKIFEGEVVAALKFSAHIIATGGSVIYSESAMKNLSHLGKIVFLHVAPRILEKRIDNADTRGMARRPGMTLEALYDERDPLYRKWADCIIEGSDSTPEVMAREIENFIEKGKCEKS